MSPLAAGWVLFLVVLVIGQMATHVIPRRWPIWVRVPAALLIGTGPVAFVAYALTVFGVRLLGGAS